MQIASFLRRIFFVFLALPHFSTLSHKRKDFNKNVIEHKMRILLSSTLFSEISLTQRRIQQHTMINVDRSVRNYTLFLLGLMKHEFSWKIFETFSNI
jgi:hypothetical protein